jgi:hypothetical protein
MANGVRIKRRHNGRTPFPLRPINRVANYGLMSQMKSIEIAKRNDAAPKAVSQQISPSQAFHGRGL